MDQSSSPSSNHAITSRIIEKVAVQEGVDSTDLFPRLFDVVDPEALKALFSQRFEGRVNFGYCGYEIAVRSGGRVTVTDSDHQPT